MTNEHYFLIEQQRTIQMWTANCYKTHLYKNNSLVFVYMSAWNFIITAWTQLPTTSTAALSVMHFTPAPCWRSHCVNSTLLNLWKLGLWLLETRLSGTTNICTTKIVLWSYKSTICMCSFLIHMQQAKTSIELTGLIYILLYFSSIQHFSKFVISQSCLKW